MRLFLCVAVGLFLAAPCAVTAGDAPGAGAAVDAGGTTRTRDAVPSAQAEQATDSPVDLLESGTRPAGEGDDGGALSGRMKALVTPPPSSTPIETEIDRLKATDGIGLGNERGERIERGFGLEIPVSKAGSVVPGYEVHTRDFGMEATEDRENHMFRIGASLKF